MKQLYCLVKRGRKFWPAKILQKKVGQQRLRLFMRRNYVELEILGENQRVRVRQRETKALTLQRIETISTQLCQNSSETEDPLRELKYRKVLRLALNLLSAEHAKCTEFENPKTKTHDLQLSVSSVNCTKTTDPPEELGAPGGDTELCHRPVKINNSDTLNKTPDSVVFTPLMNALTEGQNQHSFVDKTMKEACVPLQTHPSRSPKQTTEYSTQTGSTDSSKEEDAEDREQEDIPVVSFQTHSHPSVIKEGDFVWCKPCNSPYWPAVVKNIQLKQKKASVVFIDDLCLSGHRTQKGNRICLRNVKPLDCENAADFVRNAQEKYGSAITRSLELIRDYRIRKGCGSFCGSFLDYIVDDISSPVRNEYLSKEVCCDLSFPNTKTTAESNHMSEPQVTPLTSDLSDRHLSRRLLPDRTHAARCRANENLLQFIIKKRMVEEHLQAVLAGQERSRWLRAFLQSHRSVGKVYFEDERQVDQLYSYLKEVLETAPLLSPLLTAVDRVRFIMDVLLPEAVIHGVAQVEGVSLSEAEEKYLNGPCTSQREREEFDLLIERQSRNKSTVA